MATNLCPFLGRSFAPVFRGERLGNRSAPLFWEHQGNRAIRTENWKLVQNWDHPWNLYDMSADRSETRDVAAARPDTAFQLAAQWDTWASKTYVDPWTDQYNSAVFRNGPRQNWAALNSPKFQMRWIDENNGDFTDRADTVALEKPESLDHVWTYWPNRQGRFNLSW